MKFRRIDAYYNIYDVKESGVVYLIFDYWDDYSYCTTFNAYYREDDSKEAVELGTVKIGCLSLASKGERRLSVNGFESFSIKKLIPSELFNKLPNDFFSLGQDMEYYKKINNIFEDENTEYYDSLKDIAYDYKRFKILYEESEPCLKSSLMRNLYIPSVEQFNRISKGQAELTEYSFIFKCNEEQIGLNVIPSSLPPTNIHILIGRNGVGKTWLLHNIVCKLLDNCGVDINGLEKSNKYTISDAFSIECPQNSFAGIIGLSFSVFDDALAIDIKNKNQRLIDEFKKKYKYIGSISKSQKDGKTKVKSVEDLSTEFMEALSEISKSRNKTETYLETCKNLDSDSMFNENGFIILLESYFKNNKRQDVYLNENNGQETALEKFHEKVKKYFQRLSSGHMIIILSLTLLSQSISEKTIVLIDEPETHLHPPLLSTYIRTLSFLLLKKNAVAIIATHSPIVLQEVPKDCVNRIERIGPYMQFHKITLESFATNTDSLTREVFGLEVIKTGFYQLIEKEIENTFEESFNKFDQKVGFLGQVLMQSLINKKGDTDEKNK
jgi:predicted ATPase